jgi:hypothetical protein
MGLVELCALFGTDRVVVDGKDCVSDARPLHIFYLCVRISSDI